MPYIIPLDCVNLLRASSYFRNFFRTHTILLIMLKQEVELAKEELTS